MIVVLRPRQLPENVHEMVKMISELVTVFPSAIRMDEFVKFPTKLPLAVVGLA